MASSSNIKSPENKTNRWNWDCTLVTTLLNFSWRKREGTKLYILYIVALSGSTRCTEVGCNNYRNHMITPESLALTDYLLIHSKIPMDVVDDMWHHVCVLWNGLEELLQIFRDGERKYNSGRFQHLRIEGILVTQNNRQLRSTAPVTFLFFVCSVFAFVFLLLFPSL